MRPLCFFGLLLAPLLATGASAQPVRDIPVGQNIDWVHEETGPARYRVGPVQIAIRGRADAQMRDLIEPVVTVRFPGADPVELLGVPTRPSNEHRVSVGTWGSRPFVLLQSFSGGAHCCNSIQLAYPAEGGPRVVDIGDYNGGYVDDVPSDIDGDGRLDLVLSDDRFLYSFTSYADSMSPPRIMSVIDGRAVDVSDRPAFRQYFENGLEDARRHCVDPEEGRQVNGACAAYVATAARVGRFQQAWDEMLREYDRDARWPYVGECRVASINGACPQGQQIEYDSFPEALRASLASWGYIRR